MPKISSRERGRANKAQRHAEELSQRLDDLPLTRYELLRWVALFLTCVLLLCGFYLMPDSSFGMATKYLFAVTYYMHARGTVGNSERSIGIDLTLFVLSVSMVAVVSAAIDVFRATGRVRALENTVPGDAENSGHKPEDKR